MKIFGLGDNWLIEDQLNNELLNDFKYFFDKNLEFLYCDKEGYGLKGNNKLYWIEKRGEKPFFYKNKEYEDIERRYRKEIHKRLKAASFLRTDDTQLNHNTAWTILGEEGSYHRVHVHGTGLIGAISTVLYLDVPESEESSGDNSIFLVLNISRRNSFLKNDMPDIVHVNPKPGTLLIFPSHIPHGTYPQKKGIRHNFNVDYTFCMESKSTINYF